MRKELMVKNLNIYFECLNNTYKNNDIEPLTEFLYKLVEIYDDGLNRSYDINGVDANLVRNNKAMFVDTSIEFLTKLVKNDDYLILQEYLDISYNNGAKWYDIIYFIYALIYPKDFYEKDPKKFYEVFKTLTTNYAYHKKNEMYYLRIENYLEVYKKYFDNLDWASLADMPKMMYFNYIISVVIGNLYMDEVSVSKLPKVLDYVHDNLYYIKDFLNTNDNNNPKDTIKLRRILFTKILSDIDDKKVIM